MVANTASLARVHNPCLASLSEQLNDKRTVTDWKQNQQYQKYQKTGWNGLALISLPFPVKKHRSFFLFFSVLYPEKRQPYTYIYIGDVHVYINYQSAGSLYLSHSRFISQVHRCAYISINKQISASVLKQKSKCLRVSTKNFLSNKWYSTKCKFCLVNSSVIYYRTTFAELYK